jgi:hypothetical protein
MASSSSLGFHSTISEPKMALQILENEKKIPVVAPGKEESRKRSRAPKQSGITATKNSEPNMEEENVDEKSDENDDFMLSMLRRRLDSIEEYASRLSRKVNNCAERMDRLETQNSVELKWAYGTVICDLPLYSRFDDITLDRFSKSTSTGTRLIFIHPAQQTEKGTFMQCRLCDPSGDVETYWVQIYDKSTDTDFVVGWSLRS